MNGFRPPEPLTSFRAVLDLYTHLYVSHELPSREYRSKVHEANPGGFTYGADYRQTLTDLLIAHAIKERTA